MAIRSRSEATARHDRACRGSGLESVPGGLSRQRRTRRRLPGKSLNLLSDETVHVHQAGKGDNGYRRAEEHAWNGSRGPAGNGIHVGVEGAFAAQPVEVGQTRREDCLASLQL